MTAGPSGSSKVVPLRDAVTSALGPGDTVFLGGFGHCIPFAAASEIIRSGVSGLTVCKTGADIVLDLLVAAGVVDEIIVGWFGNPGIGSSHVIRRAMEDDGLRLSESTNFGLLLRLHAAELGVPYLPTRTLVGSDLRDRAHHVVQVNCPFTDEELSAVAALVPDVAIVHAQRADATGNVQMWGVVGDTLTGARAATRVLCTVEEIVPESRVRSAPELTALPAHRVDTVTAVPGGARPSYVDGHYERDAGAYELFQAGSRDASWVADLVAGIREGQEVTRWW